MKAFLPPSMIRRRNLVLAQIMVLVAVYTLVPPNLSAQELVLATVSINGRPLAEIAGTEESGQLRFESADLRVLLDGRLRQEILDSLFAENSRLGVIELQAVGLKASWDPMNLVLSILIPVSLSPAQVFSVARKPGPLIGELIEPEAFSAILNLAGRLGYTSEGDEQDLPFSMDSNLFFNFHGWVLELGATGAYESELTSLTLNRARIVKDFVDADARLEAGLLDSPVMGLQASQRLIGVSLQRKAFFSTRRLSVSSMNELVVENGGTARVYLNGSLIRSERLDPGLYQLAELPFSSGLNKLEVELDGSGATPAYFLNFQPFDDSFLGTGGIDYALAFGFEDGEQRRPMGTAFLRLGLNDQLDTSIAFQAGFGTALWGGSLGFATLLGNFATDAAVSIPTNQMAYPPAYAVSSRYRLNFPGRPFLPALGLFAHYASTGFTPPRRVFALEAPPASLRLAGSLSIALTSTVSAALSLENRRNLDEQTEASSAALTIQRRMGGGLTLSGIGTLEARSDGSINPALTISMLSAPAQSKQSFQYSQELFQQSSSFDLSGILDENIGLEGSIRGRNILGHSEETMSLAAQTRFRLRFGDLGAGVSWDIDPLTGLPSNSLRVSASTALVLAGGVLSLSQMVPDSFVVLAPRPSLKDETVSLQLGSAGADVKSVEGASSVGLLPSYRVTQAYVDLPDAQAEIVADRPFLILSAGYRSGTVVQPGAKASLGFGGRLLDASGNPVSWTLGTLEASDQETSNWGLDQGFTDANGRFEFFGLEPGDYYVIWETDPAFIMEVKLEPNAGLMVEFGDFTLGAPTVEADE